MIAGIDSGWAAAAGTLILALGTVTGLWLEQRRTRRKALREEAAKDARLPSDEMTATTHAAEAIARASAQLIQPFQDAIRSQEGQIGELREAVRNVQAREAECQRELESTKVELHATRLKLREVTDTLGLHPDGLPPSSPSGHPE